jgi:hypothetical protein
MKRFFILQQESTKEIRKVEEITSPDRTYGETDEGVNRHGLSVCLSACHHSPAISYTLVSWTMLPSHECLKNIQYSILTSIFYSNLSAHYIFSKQKKCLF